MKDAKQQAMQNELEKKSTQELKDLLDKLQAKASTKAEMDQVSLVQSELSRRGE